MSKPPIIHMVYAILTTPGKGGMPFQNGERPPQAPGNPLRISEDATLLAFENQPDRVFANQYARVSGKLLWYITKDVLHPDDLLVPDETFSSYREFKAWLSSQENG